MNEIVELKNAAVDLWEYYFPTPLTPQQKIDQALDHVKKQQSALVREEWGVKARMERVDRELTQASKTRNKTEMERMAREKVSVENQRHELQNQARELNMTREDVMRMNMDQTRAKALLDVMAATNEIAVEPARATETIFRYQQTVTVRDCVNELVNEAMEQRREELEEARADQVEANKARIEEVMAETWQVANAELAQHLPRINVHGKVPPLVVTGSEKEMARQNRDQQQQVNMFLAHAQK